MSKLFMLIGIPGSGKSTASQKLSEIYNAPIYSSDDIRKELYGDASVQDNPKKVFDILHKRIIEGLNKYYFDEDLQVFAERSVAALFNTEFNGQVYPVNLKSKEKKSGSQD